MPHVIAITETRLKTFSNLQLINLLQYIFVMLTHEPWLVELGCTTVH